MFHQTELTNEMVRLRKFSLRLTRNAGNAEDLLQSTLLRALEKMAHFEQGTNLFGWASKIMYNIFVSDYRRKKKFETQYDPAFHIDRIAVGPSQEDYVDLVTVSEKINLLSAEHREVLTLICVQELHYGEAADILHIPVGTVRSRLSRARNNLRDLMIPVPLPHPSALPLPTAHHRIAA